MQTLMNIIQRKKRSNSDRKMLSTMKAQIVMTCGGEGAWSHVRGETMHQPAFSVPVVDTTCAGDTFTGFPLTVIVYISH